jgi:hypothetical protein
MKQGIAPKYKFNESSFDEAFVTDSAAPGQITTVAAPNDYYGIRPVGHRAQVPPKKKIPEPESPKGRLIQLKKRCKAGLCDAEPGENGYCQQHGPLS